MTGIETLVNYFAGNTTKAEAQSAIASDGIDIQDSFWTEDSVVYDTQTQTYRNPYNDTPSGQTATEEAIRAGTSITNAETTIRINSKDTPIISTLAWSYKPILAVIGVIVFLYVLLRRK